MLTVKHSIIIPTAGRPVSIILAIESVLVQIDGTASELIVVDNNTDEELSHQLREYCNRHDKRLRYVRERSPGLSAARHGGAEVARGEVLTFLDDDVIVGDTWLVALDTAFSDPAVAMAGGPSVPRFTGGIPAWFWAFIGPTPYGGWMCPWLSLLDIGAERVYVDPNYIWGLNFSIRKTVMYDCGGFHPDLVPSTLQRWQGDGETGLTAKVRAKGLRAEYRQQAMLWHTCGPDRLNLAYFKKRAFYQGVCDSFTQIRAGASPTPEHPSQRPPARATTQNPYRRVRALAGNLVRSRFRSVPERVPSSNPWIQIAEPVTNATDNAYKEGWNFHQQAVAEDPALLDWVRRSDYFETDVRTMHYSAISPAADRPTGYPRESR
jgi:glycosyltransferase involved in cell wall biosynthesis